MQPRDGRDKAEPEPALLLVPALLRTSPWALPTRKKLLPRLMGHCEEPQATKQSRREWAPSPRDCFASQGQPLRIDGFMLRGRPLSNSEKNGFALPSGPALKADVHTPLILAIGSGEQGGAAFRVFDR